MVARDGVAILLAKSKVLLGAVFKLKFLLTFAAFMGVYWSLYGPSFGVGFAVLILIHELGHLIDVKRRGLPASISSARCSSSANWRAKRIPTSR